MSILISENVRALSKAHFSIPFLVGACVLARDVYEIEFDYRGQPGYLETYGTIHRAKVLGSIISSVALLESALNEICSDSAEVGGGRLSVVNGERRQILARMWQQGKLKRPMLDKYGLVLKALADKSIDKSRKPTQDVALLIKLRNAIVHYEPEWQEYGEKVKLQGRAKDLGLSLEKKFRHNPLTGQGNPLYPDKILGYGCAKWAIRSSISFLDQFHALLGIQPHYAPHRHQVELP